MNCLTNFQLFHYGLAVPSVNIHSPLSGTMHFLYGWGTSIYIRIKVLGTVTDIRPVYIVKHLIIILIAFIPFVNLYYKAQTDRSGLRVKLDSQILTN